jgi:hypothetical protein
MRASSLLRGAILVVVAAAAWFSQAGSASAQQATISTPFHSVRDGFFEQVGTQWGFNWRGINAQFGGGNMGQPPFGSPDANAGLRGGFGLVGPHGSGHLNFVAAQGSRRSFTSQTPTLTLMNGQTGFVSDTSQSPFVISFIPVVGGFPTFGTLVPAVPPPAVMHPVPGDGPVSGNAQIQAYRRMLEERNRAAHQRRAFDDAGLPPPPTVERPLDQLRRQAAPQPAQPAGGLNFVADAATPTPAAPEPLVAGQTSSAARAAPSVEEARRLHELEQAAGQEEALALWERALSAEEGGKSQVARIYYEMVARRASGELRRQAVERLSHLSHAASHAAP